MAINKKRLQGAAETTALVPSENFNTVIYTGNDSTQSITNVGFQPDLVWFKNRAGISHAIVDSVRTRAKYIFPDDTAIEASSASDKDLVSFDTNGFTLGATSAAGSTNASTGTIVAWCWKAPDSFSHSASGSQLASSGKSNQAAGFSIVSYTGNGSTGATITHNLGASPELVICKSRDSVAGWNVFSSSLSTNFMMKLDNNAQAFDGSAGTNGGAFTVSDTLLTVVGGVATQNNNNKSGDKFIAYCFTSITEYSKVGSYTGNNSTSNFVNCDFEPAWLLVKRTDADANWRIVDNKRNTTNPRNSALYPSLPNAEYTNAVENVNFTTTGFEIATTDTNWNASAGNYLFYAIAADPDTTTPTLAKSFNVDTYTGNGATQQIGSVNTLFTKYAVFNGSSSYMTIPTIGKTRTQSFSFWFRTNTTSTSALLSSNGGSSSNKGVLILFESGGNVGKIRLQTSGSTGSVNFERTSGAYNNGQWHHLVAAYDCTSAGDNTFLYIDGLLILDFNSNQWSSGTSTNDVHIGANNTSGAESFKGQIDQFRVYNALLTASQVTELYNETATTASTLNYPTGAGCLALYEFNDDADDTGNNYDGTIVNVTYDSFLFKPDLVIIKNRETTDGWRWFDTQRGVLNRLESDATSAAADLANSLTSFNNAGFTVESEATVNTSSEDYISISLKMLDNNNNVPVENTVGTIKSLTSVNANAGMSITKYTGNGTQNATIGHGLTSAPDMVVIKNLDQNDSWFVSHSGLDSNQFVEFNTTAVAATNSDLNHQRLSTTFKTTSASPHHMINASGEKYIMYSFHSISGFSKFGTYTWTGANYTSGAMVSDLGFTPDFVMIKGKNEDSNFSVYDSERGATSGTNQRYRLALNDFAAETISGYQGIGFDNNGFSAIVGADGNTTGSGGLNKQNGVYIYWAMKIN